MVSVGYSWDEDWDPHGALITCSMTPTGEASISVTWLTWEDLPVINTGTNQ